MEKNLIHKTYQLPALILVFLVLALAGLTTSSPALADATPSSLGMSKGQTLYVPAYSHIYIGHKATPYKLTVTLSIRNIDPDLPFTLFAVDYHGTEGSLIKHYLDKPITIAPMATARYVVPSPDKTGGSGANFIVKWNSTTPLNPPIVEAIMIGTQSQQGISFTSRGQEILKK